MLALGCAVVGGALVLLVPGTAGWLHGDRKTVVLQETAPAQAAAAPVRPAVAGVFDPARVYARRSPGVVTLYSVFSSGNNTSASQGSGFVVSPDGLILTNSHVITTAGEGDGNVRPAGDVFVEFQDRDRVKATIVGWDVFDDVGVLRVDPKAHELTPLPLGDSSRVVVGQPVAAIGSPFGNENSLAVGVVSATQRSIESLTSRYNLVDAIQVDAPINHGNSGGPLFDAAGRVIGINAQIRSDSGNAEGVGFAVPINAARRSMAGAGRDREGRVRLRRDHVGGPHARNRQAVRLPGALRRGDHVRAAGQPGRARRPARRRRAARLQRLGVHVRRRCGRLDRRQPGAERIRRRPGGDRTAPSRPDRARDDRA